jgi:lipopolysaccharide/colanic/teichoic acid biosynthesis glycosyltransferase
MPSTLPTAKPHDLASTPLDRNPPRQAPEFIPETQVSVYQFCKPVLDFCVAAVLLVLASPVILLCALLVRLTSRGPAFYSQVRLGRGGRPYWIYKLRTMGYLCETKSGAVWSQAGDPRVTPLGRFLRATHLDELPQLWNVLRGDMSLIGPRPERPEFVPALADAIPLYEARMLVRPGVTGFAQVQLPADSDLSSVRTKLSYDLYYVGKAGLWMDVRIILATLLKVFHVPFGVIRKVFLFPAPVAVERYYQESQKPRPDEQPLPVPQLVAGQ